MEIRIAIVEDEKSHNNTLFKVVDFQMDMCAVAQFFDGFSALRMLPLIKPDVVLMDIHLPDRSGIEVVKALKGNLETTQFLMCTSHEEDELIFNSLKAGASGYILKGESMERIFAAIREVHQGGAPMSFSIARKVIRFFEGSKNKGHNLQALTEREEQVLLQLSKGFLYKEIADKLFISTETVKKHIGNIYKKLQVNNKIEALNKYYQYKT